MSQDMEHDPSVDRYAGTGLEDEMSPQDEIMLAYRERRAQHAAILLMAFADGSIPGGGYSVRDGSSDLWTQPARPGLSARITNHGLVLPNRELPPGLGLGLYDL